MAITNAQQARQLYKKGKRVGFFTAGLAAGDNISPGTSTSGGSRNNSNNNNDDDNRQNYNVDKKTVQTGPKKTDTRTLTSKDYDRGQSNFREQFNDYSGGARMLDSAYSTLSQRNNQKYQNRIYDARRNNIISQLQAAGLLTDEDEDMTVEQLRDKFQNSTDTVGADYGDRTMKSFDEISTIQDMVDKGFYKKDGVFDKNSPNYDPSRIPTPFNEVDLPGIIGTAANFIGKKMAGPLTSEYLGKQFDELEDIGSIPFDYDRDTSIKGLMKEYEPNRYEREYGDETGGGGDQQTDPCLGPNPPAYCNVGGDDEEDATPKRNLGGLAPRFAGSIFDFDGMADGGRAGAMDGGRMMNNDTPEGGIMDLESGRQMYFLGKLVKKATRAVKKVAKSPVGKAALLYFGGNALMGGMKGSSLFGKGPGSAFVKMFGANNTMPGFENLSTAKMGGFLESLGLTKGYGSMMPTIKGGILAASTLPLLMGQKEEEDNNDDYYKTNRLNIADIRYNRPIETLMPAASGSRFKFAADGGLMRTGYAEGSEEPVAKKTMPLLDMDGQEMDLREEGGFVPLGRMERADDVPARLSKNEFVFTADAVRNAGEGDVDKGAEVMYNMMKNLESGGEVSEESQGLEGAREMFKTSQRLEEVI